MDDMTSGTDSARRGQDSSGTPDASGWCVSTRECTADALVIGHARCTDVDEHAESLRAWDQRYEQLSAGPFRGELLDVWMPGVQVFRERTNQVLSESGRAWPGASTVGVVMAARGGGVFCGRPIDPLGGLVLGRPGDFSLRTPADLDIVAIVLDTASPELAGAIGQEPVLGWLAESPPEVLHGSHCLDGLRGLARGFLDQVLRDATPFRHDAGRQGFLSSLAGSLVALHEPAAAGALTASVPVGHSGRVGLVERARAHVTAHRDRPVTVAELCAAIEVSRRTLQYAFQDVLGVSPAQFLRAVRLNGARRELKRAGEGGRVGDVAARWGFWHFSQFAADYRRMFGERPSDTLRGDRTGD